MTVERAHRGKGPYVIVCDAPGCGVRAETGRFDFHVAIRQVKDARWTVFKSGEQWLHNCPKHGATGCNGEES